MKNVDIHKECRKLFDFEVLMFENGFYFYFKTC